MDEAEMHRMAVFATVLVRMKTAAAEPVPRPVQLSAEENEVMVYVIRLLTRKEKVESSRGDDSGSSGVPV